MGFTNHHCDKYDDVVQTIVDAGGGVIPVGNNRFYMAWFPEHWGQDDQATLIITLHGSGGCAESQMENWYEMTASRSYAIVALQYAEGEKPFNDQWDDAPVVYQNLSSTIEQLRQHCPLNDANVFVHGFSRGSARTFELAVLDQARAGMGAVDAFIADSGAWTLGKQGPPVVRAAEDDPEAYLGARYWMYCGEQDNVNGFPMCDAMTVAHQYVLERGGTVDEFYRDPNGGHGMFHERDLEHPGPVLPKLFEYIDSL